MKFVPRSLATRQRIIERTAEIFNKKGYAGTSVSDLTQATNLTKGSIYGNFENKEDVALAAFDHNLDRVRKVIRERVVKGGTYAEKILAYVTVYNDVDRGLFPVGGCPILNTAIEADDTHVLLKNKAAKAILVWKEELVDLLKKGIETEEFKDTTNSDKIALSIIALIEGGIMIGRVTGNKAYLDSILTSVKDLVDIIRS